MTAVFVSWSGQRGERMGHVFARVLEETTAAMERPVQVSFSPLTVIVGRQWRPQLEEQLSQADFGVTIVEPDALRSLWLAYEAGFIEGGGGPTQRVPPIFVFVLGDRPAKVSGTPFDTLQCAAPTQRALEQFARTIFAVPGVTTPPASVSLVAERLHAALATEWRVICDEENATRAGVLQSLNDVVDDYVTFGLLKQRHGDEVRHLLTATHPGMTTSRTGTSLARELSEITRLFHECQMTANEEFGTLATEWAINHLIVYAREQLGDIANGKLPVKNRAPVRKFWMDAVFGRASENVWTTNVAKPEVTMGGGSAKNLLQAQGSACRRGVGITRLFVYDPDMSDEEAEQRRGLMRRQVDVGISVKVITTADFRTRADEQNAISRIGSDDFMIIDDAFVYLTFPAASDEISAELVNGHRHSATLEAAQSFRDVLDDWSDDVTRENVDEFPNLPSA